MTLSTNYSTHKCITKVFMNKPLTEDLLDPTVIAYNGYDTLKIFDKNQGIWTCHCINLQRE